jgi:hypothetical protein
MVFPDCSITRNHTVYSKDASSPYKPSECEALNPLVYKSVGDVRDKFFENNCGLGIFIHSAIASTIDIHCSSSTLQIQKANLKGPIAKQILFAGVQFNPGLDRNLGKVVLDSSSLYPDQTHWKRLSGLPAFDHGLTNCLYKSRNAKGYSLIELPDYSSLVTDCGKMKVFDALMKQLKEGNHKVLIFCQMTRMLDLLEEFLTWKRYPYFRLDGSTQITDRRDMVEEFQNNPNIFCFLLSTRAGGLGVTLTAADTVIFYDNDWNPTMDAQATDRAHRIGQTKTVSVYRLITKGPVEEKIVKRAQQK